MENRITHLVSKNRNPENPGEPKPIGAILAELLAQYQVRFPDARIAIVETSAAAI
jgi:hypothetical protein